MLDNFEQLVEAAPLTAQAPKLAPRLPHRRPSTARSRSSSSLGIRTFSDVKRSPLLGEHTDEVLAELGYGADQITALRTEKVI